MKLLLLPLLLTVLCFTGFMSQVQAQQSPASISLEHGGTSDVMGSREFNVVVCNEFEVELWIRDLLYPMTLLNVYITWDPDLMELQNVELNLPTFWRVVEGPFEQTDSWYAFILSENGGFASNWKWMTFTFHCKGEGSSPINIPEVYEHPSGGLVAIGPGGPDINNKYTTRLKPVVTQNLAPVGGLVTPINKLAILTPYIALTGLITIVLTVYFIKRVKT